MRFYLLFGKILDLLWQIMNVIGQIFVDVNGQMLQNNLVTLAIKSWPKAFKISPKWRNLGKSGHPANH